MKKVIRKKLTFVAFAFALAGSPGWAQTGPATPSDSPAPSDHAMGSMSQEDMQKMMKKVEVQEKSEKKAKSKH